MDDSDLSELGEFWGARLSDVAALAVLAADFAGLWIVLNLSAGALRVAASVTIMISPGVVAVPLSRARGLAMALLMALLVSSVVDIVVSQAVTYLSGFSWRASAIGIVAFATLAAPLRLAVSNPRSA